MKSFKSFLNEEIYFEEFLLEAKDDATKEGGVSNNTKGVLHELLVGKHLNNGQHMTKHENAEGETPQQAHDRLKKQIHPNDYKRIESNAKSAAADIHKNIQASHPGHVIHGVHWTSKPGDTEKVTGVKATQKQDSSDIYVSTHHPKKPKDETHHGYSLKVSDKSSKNVPSSSLGMKSSGEKAQSLYKEHQKKIKTMHPELEGKNEEARKEWAQKNPEKHNQVKAENKKLLANVAHHHAAELQHHLDSGNHEHVVNHIRDVLAAKSTPAAEAGKANFAKHTTYQTAKGVQHHTANPAQDYEHILKDHKNIKVKASGGSVHFSHTDPKTGKETKFASQAHKFDSQSDPLSTIKSAGKAV
jgi:hypothetical protein